MNLGELKKSLSRMSPDLDDCPVMVTYPDKDGKSEYDYLGFTAYSDLPEAGVVFILGSDKEARNRIINKTLHYPDGSEPAVEDVTA
jgi:hypothetical protein